MNTSRWTLCMLLLLFTALVSLSSAWFPTGTTTRLATTSTSSWRAEVLSRKKSKSNNIVPQHYHSSFLHASTTDAVDLTVTNSSSNNTNIRRVTIVGAGWAGLSAAHRLLEQEEANVEITLVDAAPRVGGLVRDGFLSKEQQRQAEAGQHGFWRNYVNIFRFLRDTFGDNNLNDILTDYAPQGQYSPRGLEAVWPVYKDQKPKLPTGLAQLFYTEFLKLPLLDRISALPLVIAFSEFDNSPEAWERYDSVSFRDLCLRLGVSKRCYEEAFEPMILTGLFAPGRECSAAAALGMAYFFVLQSQTAFDVRWCRGNIGERIFQPWVEQMKDKGLRLECSTRVVGFDMMAEQDGSIIKAVQCVRKDGSSLELITDDVILAVSAKALSSFANYCPNLAAVCSEFRDFANLRGTSVLATRLYLDKNVTMIYSANACWGFHEGVGMTFFDIRAIHGADNISSDDSVGSIVEVDYYHANSLLALSDDDLIKVVKQDLDQLLGIKCEQANVVDAAIVRLPGAVNWYFPGSYKIMPNVKSKNIANLYFAGDIVKTDHGSWSQEKAFVTGMEAANILLGHSADDGVLPVEADENHVQAGKFVMKIFNSLLRAGKIGRAPFLFDWPF